MEMVAAAKMRKAQERMRAARPYAEKDRVMSQRIFRMQIPSIGIHFSVNVKNGKNVGLIIVTSDKGLCGGLNTNVLRLGARRDEGLGGGRPKVKVAPSATRVWAL